MSNQLHHRGNVLGVLGVHDDGLLVVREHVALGELLRHAVLCAALAWDNGRDHLCVREEVSGLLQAAQTLLCFYTQGLLTTCLCAAAVYVCTSKKHCRGKP